MVTKTWNFHLAFLPPVSEPVCNRTICKLSTISFYDIIVFIIDHSVLENWLHFFLGLEKKEKIAGSFREPGVNVTCELSGLKSMFLTQDFCSKIWQKTR